MKNLLLFAASLAVVACGREPEANATSVSSTQTPTMPATADSVAAVAQTPGKHPLFVRFVLEGRPSVGNVSKLRLELAGEPGPVAVRLQGEGITVDPAIASLTVLDNGEPTTQSVAITPQAAGISELKVMVRSASEEAQEITYAIPLLVEK